MKYFITIILVLSVAVIIFWSKSDTSTYNSEEVIAVKSESSSVIKDFQKMELASQNDKLAMIKLKKDKTQEDHQYAKPKKIELENHAAKVEMDRILAFDQRVNKIEPYRMEEISQKIKEEVHLVIQQEVEVTNYRDFDPSLPQDLVNDPIFQKAQAKLEEMKNYFSEEEYQAFVDAEVQKIIKESKKHRKNPKKLSKHDY